LPNLSNIQWDIERFEVAYDAAYIEWVRGAMVRENTHEKRLLEKRLGINA
jgi:hypothetical protein